MVAVQPEVPWHSTRQPSPQPRSQAALPVQTRVTSSSPPDTSQVVPPEQVQVAVSCSQVQVPVQPPVTQRTVLDAIEVAYPTLRGTIRDYKTGLRRPLLRFFACEEDLSHEPPDAPLPDDVVSGKEPFLIVGAMAGG